MKKTRIFDIIEVHRFVIEDYIHRHCTNQTDIKIKTFDTLEFN